MSLEYKEELLENCLDELKPYLEKHYKEVGLYQDSIDLNPDYDKYLEMEKLGIIHTVTARDDGKLVGYFISIVTINLHYSDHKYAMNDILYIDEDYRKSGAAMELFAYAEQCLKDMGVSVITIHMKTKLPFDSLCDSLEYDYSERLYTKYIGA